MEYIENRYGQLITQIKDKNPNINIYLCSLCPRGDTDVIKVNDVIKQLSETHSCIFVDINKSRKENPQKLTQLSSRSHPRHLVGKRTAQKDITIDTTSDSQVNSNFPNKWSPASLTFNNYFYLF